MSDELIKELELLEPGEDLAIRRVGDSIQITRTQDIGGMLKSCSRLISLSELKFSKVDALAYGIKKTREAMSNTVGDALFEAVGLTGKDKK